MCYDRDEILIFKPEFYHVFLNAANSCQLCKFLLRTSTPRSPEQLTPPFPSKFLVTSFIVHQESFSVILLKSFILRLGSF